MLDENWAAKIADFGETQHREKESGGKSLASFLGPLSGQDGSGMSSTGDARGSYGRFGNRRSSGKFSCELVIIGNHHDRVVSQVTS